MKTALSKGKQVSVIDTIDEDGNVHSPVVEAMVKYAPTLFYVGSRQFLRTGRTKDLYLVIETEAGIQELILLEKGSQ